MNMQVTAELLEENERLRERLKEYKDDAVSRDKVSDFVMVLFAAGIYFLAVTFLLQYALTGILYTISVSRGIDIALIITMYLTCRVFLYFIGIVAAGIAVLGIYREELTDFVYRLTSAIAHSIERADEEDEFSYLDEEIMMHVEEEIKRDLVPRKVAKKRKLQARGPNGKFVSGKASTKERKKK